MGVTELWFVLLVAALGVLVFAGLRTERRRKVRRAAVGDRPCDVYLYDLRGGGVAYVGEGYDWRERRRRHRRAWWWPLVASETPRVLRCANKAAARALETQLIREHLPAGNTQGIPCRVLRARRRAAGVR